MSQCQVYICVVQGRREAPQIGHMAAADCAESASDCLAASQVLLT